MYPIIMIVVGTVLMSGIFIFVIPKLAKIFTSRKMELPIPTKICIIISNFLRNYWCILLIGLVVGFFGYLESKFLQEKVNDTGMHFYLKLQFLER